MKKESFVVTLVIGTAIALALAASLVLYSKRQNDRKAWRVHTTTAGVVRMQNDVPDFEFAEANGGKVSSSDLRGAPYVAGFLFTRCGTTCPPMTKQLQLLDDMIADHPDVKFLWITVDPKNDTPEVLNAYAKDLEVSRDRWKFLAGSKSEIHRIATKGFRLAGPSEEVHHSSRLALVDGEGRIVGYYDGAGENRAAHRRLLAEDIRRLKRGEKLSGVE